MSRTGQDRGVGHHLLMVIGVTAVRPAGKRMLNSEIAVELLDLALMPNLVDLGAVGIARVFTSPINDVVSGLDRDIAGQAQFRDESAALDFPSGIHIRHTPHHQVCALRLHLDVVAVIP